MKKVSVLVLGIIFGIILSKSEVISWFRIQEMFRFQSIHMYAVICSAIVVGMISILILKKFKVKTFYGEDIDFPKKEFHRGNIFGGAIFGLGWAITGACPGPLFALFGAGYTAIIMIIISALFGVWCYGVLKDKL